MEWDEDFFLVSAEGTDSKKIPHCLTHKESQGLLFCHGVKSEPRLGSLFTNCTLQHEKRGEKRLWKKGNN